MDNGLALMEKYRIAAVVESLKRRGYNNTKAKLDKRYEEWKQSISVMEKAKEDWEEYKEKRGKIKEEIKDGSKKGI